MGAFWGRLGLKSQNIALVGAGANGAGIGAGLAHAGLDVTFIEPAHAEAMRRTGFGSSCQSRLWSHLFTAFHAREQRRLGPCAPVNEALIAIAARIESGVFGPLAFERQPSEVGARGPRRSLQGRP